VEEGKGKTLKVTTKEEDELLAAIEGLPHVEIGPVAFSPDSELVAVGTGLGQVKFFKARTGELVRTLDDEKAKLAEKETPEKLKALKRAMGGVGTLAFSPDGNLLAMTGSSFEDVGANWGGIERLRLPVVGPGRLKIWDVKTGALKHDLAGHSQAFTAGFTFDGSVLVSAGRGITSNHDNGIIAWNPQTGEKLTAIPIVANGGTHSLAFSPTKKLVAVSSILFDKENNTSSTSLRLIYPLSGITEWDRNLPGWAAPKGFSADGKFVAVLRGEAAIEFLDVETASTKQEIMAEGFLPDKPREGARWTDAMIAPRAGKLVIGGVGKDRKGSVEIWDLSGLGAAAAKKDDQKQ